MAKAKGSEKTGGRKKGTLNKDKNALRDMIAEKYPDYHPVMAMVEIANDNDNDIVMRANMHKEVAMYIESKRKSIEISGELDSRVTYKPLVKRLDGSIDEEDQ